MQYLSNSRCFWCSGTDLAACVLSDIGVLGYSYLHCRLIELLLASLKKEGVVLHVGGRLAEKERLDLIVSSSNLQLPFLKSWTRMIHIFFMFSVHLPDFEIHLVLPQDPGISRTPCFDSRFPSGLLNMTHPYFYPHINLRKLKLCKTS